MGIEPSSATGMQRDDERPEIVVELIDAAVVAEA